MAIQYVNVGNVVNDGTGDDLYTAFTKVNDNFRQIDFAQAQNNTISNVGQGIGIYKEKIGSDLRLKSVIAGDGISILDSGVDLTITNTSYGIHAIHGDDGAFEASSLNDILNIVGGGNTTVTIVGNILTIDATFALVNDMNPQLGADLDLNGNNITGTGEISADNFYGTFNGEFLGNLTGDVTGNVTGNLTGTVNHINVADLAKQINDFDFGPIVPLNLSPNVNFLTWLKTHLGYDMGTFTNPGTTITGTSS